MGWRTKEMVGCKRDEQKEYETDLLKVVIPNCLY